MTNQSILNSDLDNLQAAINELRNGTVGDNAAKVRYYAALVSRSAENAKLPRNTSCQWDLAENAKERQ